MCLELRLDYLFEARRVEFREARIAELTEEIREVENKIREEKLCNLKR
jgi:hypothetical protein